MNCSNLPIVCFQNTFQNLWGGMGLIWGNFFFGLFWFFSVSLFRFMVRSCMKVKLFFASFRFMDRQPQFC